MIVLSTDDLEEVIKFYTEVLGFPLKFRDSAHPLVTRHRRPGSPPCAPWTATYAVVRDGSA